MSVNNVEGHSHTLVAYYQGTAVRARSPLQLDFWHENLDSCPDLELKSKCYDGLQNGVDIECEGHITGRVCDNWPSALEHDIEVSKFIHNNLSLGRVVGPWSHPPCDGYVASPIGAFIRSGSNKVRVIHDLSYPAGDSINDHIDPDKFNLQYVTVDDAAKMCSQFHEAWMAKSDLASAFLHVLVKPQYWHLLGFKWKGLYYAFSVLPFGCRASPKLFDTLACGLEYMAKNRGTCNYTCHYLDDTFTCNSTRESCQASIDIFNETARLAGFTVQEDKCTKASQVMEFLGVVINTVEGTLSISQERMSEIVSLLEKWQQKRSCTKRQLLTLIGKLSFAARVIRSGRTFLRRLIDLSKKAKHLHHRLKLNVSAKLDMKWWLNCIASHNGITMFPSDWSESNYTIMFSDASDQACAFVWGNKWSVCPFQGKYTPLKDTPIHFRELLAVCKGVATCGNDLRNSKLKVMVDNQAICYAINSGTIKCVQTMELIRSLYFMLCMYNIDIKAEYIHTKDNVWADALSRLDMSKFWCTCPGAQRSMTFPADVKYYDSYI